MLALLLVGCPWFDELDRAAVIDGDGDGVSASAFGGDDCDDANAEIGAPATTAYADADGDGFGDAATSSLRCRAGGGWVEDDTDCNDTEPAVGRPTDAWPDGDRDGYAADDTDPVTSCPTEALVTTRGDCDDADADVHPGAVEHCFGEEDSNCDGGFGGEACTVAGLGPEMQGTRNGYGAPNDYAYTTLGEVDIDGDGVLDVVVSTPYGYEVHAFSGVDLLAGADLDLDDALLTFDEFHYLLGKALIAADATGDGVDDLLMGCPGTDEDLPEGSAELVVLELPASGNIGRSDGIVRGVERGGWFGSALAWNDDVDGAPAVLVGAPVENTSEGAAWLVEMPLPDDEAHPVTDLRAASTTGLPGLGDGYGLGWDVAWVDDAAGDIAVVSDQAAWYGEINSGVVALWPAAYTGAPAVSTDSGRGLYGEFTYEGFGFAIAVGDENGDGEDDLAVGSPHAMGQKSGAGVVYVYHSIAALEGWKEAGAADLQFLGDDRINDNAESQAQLGVDVAFVGDMNGDGRVDLAMGAPFEMGLAGQRSAGAVFVAPGGLADGEHEVEEAAWARYGDAVELHVGFGLSPAGDIDEDGRADLLVGMPGWRDSSGTVSGAVTMWWGSQL